MVAQGVYAHFQASTFFRAEAFRRTPGFNPRNISSWDSELLLELFLSGARIRVIDEFLSTYRLHATSITNTGAHGDDARRFQSERFVRLMGRERRWRDDRLAIVCRFLKRRGIRERRSSACCAARSRCGAWNEPDPAGAARRDQDMGPPGPSRAVRGRSGRATARSARSGSSLPTGRAAGPAAQISVHERDLVDPGPSRPRPAPPAIRAARTKPGSCSTPSPARSSAGAFARPSLRIAFERRRSTGRSPTWSTGGRRPPASVYYVPAGTIHALGPGLVLIEVQQNSDLTYRLYDYGRPRPLHVEDGIKAVNPLAAVSREESSTASQRARDTLAKREFRDRAVDRPGICRDRSGRARPGLADPPARQSAGRRPGAGAGKRLDDRRAATLSLEPERANDGRLCRSGPSRTLPG